MHFRFTISLFLLLSAGTTALAQNYTTYVWAFSMRNGEKNDITTSITEDFETALISTNCCSVLQRRSYARLIEQQQNELKISSYQELPLSRKNALKSNSANSVIFGEIFDDVASGTVKISVSLESLGSGIILKKGDVFMARYELNDPFKRQEKMKVLVGKLGWVVSDAPRGEEEGFEPVGAFVKQTRIMDDCKYVLDGCQRSGNTVTIKLTITSREVDTQLAIVGYYMRIYDEAGNEYAASDIQIARGGASALLVADVPIKAVLSFTNVYKNARQFTLFNLVTQANHYGHKTVEFRKIPIQQ